MSIQLASRRLSALCRHLDAANTEHQAGFDERNVKSLLCSAVGGSQEAELDWIEDKVAALRAGFNSRGTHPLSWRLQQVDNVRRLVEENQDALANAVHKDLGRSPFQALATEVRPLLKECALFAAKLAEWMTPTLAELPVAHALTASASVAPEPLGVVCVIAPWNFPVVLTLMPLIGALGAGNRVLLKPSEVSATCSRLLAELIPRYFDPATVAVVEGGVPETTRLLRSKFDHIIYTGNGHVARIVMAAAARHLTPVTLELGGKNPAIVDGTADLGVTARRLLFGKLTNAGQICMSPDYLLVLKSVWPALREQLVGQARAMFGDDPRHSDDFSRIINERHAARIADMLQEPEEKRGRVVMGGDVDIGARYVAPTILEGTSEDSLLMRDEIFGPVLPVLLVDSLSEAIEFIRARPKPLVVYLFSNDPEAHTRVGERTSSGALSINECLLHYAFPSLPFGGVGESGMGAYRGHHSFTTFSHKKAVLHQSGRASTDVPVRYPPFTDSKKWWVSKLM